VKRAIAVYLENKENLIGQFWGLYASLKYINSNDTDMVVFGPLDVLEKIPDDCIKIECNPISHEYPWSDPRLPSPYHFINSIYFLCTPEAEILLNYDYVLKTDVDTFLTPKWNEFYPENYTSGRGRYINDDLTADKMINIANDLGLNHKGIYDIGATHYGKPELVLKVMKLTYSTSKYILENVFKDDLGKWPSLFYGVTTMYGGEIAVNHLIDNLIQAPDKMDCRSDSNMVIKEQIHLHSYHTFEIFSKFKFESGEYDNIDISKLNTNIISDYCLYMALNGKKIRNGEKVEKLNKNFTSIIILTWNNLGYTKECIRSIREHTNKDLYEIIVADNNSTDGTVEWLKNERDLKCIFNETNNGFSKGNNQGIEIAIGDSVLFLNNDTVVAPNWLENLRTALFSSEEIGAVGPLTNFASYLQEINVPYQLDDMGEMIKFAREFNISDSSKWEERLKLIGFCMLVKMDIVKKIGGLDESFSPAHYEDDDYCFRILKEGYKILLCKDTFIHHHGSKSVGSLSSNGLDSIYHGKNVFINKWGFDSPTGIEKLTNITNILKEPIDKKMNVLEIGCGCGETLLHLKNKFKNVKLYGIEKDVNKAAVAATFANISNIDLEKEELPFYKNLFDVIILGNKLGQFKDPVKLMKILKLYLTPTGIILNSNENIMNNNVILDLIKGKWNREENKNNIKFFTLDELNKIYEESGLKIKEMVYSNKKINPEFIEKLCNITTPDLKWLYEAHTFYHTLYKEKGD